MTNVIRRALTLVLSWQGALVQAGADASEDFGESLAAWLGAATAAGHTYQDVMNQADQTLLEALLAAQTTWQGAVDQAEATRQNACWSAWTAFAAGVASAEGQRITTAAPKEEQAKKDLAAAAVRAVTDLGPSLAMTGWLKEGAFAISRWPRAST